MDLHLVVQVFRTRELFEERVVVRPDVGNGLVEGHVEHASRAKQLVEGDSDEKGGLADTVTGEHDAEVAGAKTSVEALLQQAKRAAGVQELAIQGRPSTFDYSSSSLARSGPCSSISFFWISAGTGR